MSSPLRIRGTAGPEVGAGAEKVGRAERDGTTEGGARLDAHALPIQDLLRRQLGELRRGGGCGGRGKRGEGQGREQGQGGGSRGALEGPLKPREGEQGAGGEATE